MKVSSRESLINLLDIAINLAELLNLMLDDWEKIMEGSVCNNTHLLQGALNHR